MVSEVPALAGDLGDRAALLDPGEDALLVAEDLLGARQHVERDLARHADRAVAVADDDVAWPDEDVADAHRDVVVRDLAAPEAAVRAAVAVVDGKVLGEDLRRVADAA